MARRAHRLAGLLIIWLAQLNSTVQKELVWFCGEAEHVKVELNSRTLSIGDVHLQVIEWNRMVLRTPVCNNEREEQEWKKKKSNFFLSSSSQIWDRLLMQRRSHPFWMRIWCDPFVLFGWLYCVAQHSLTSIRKKFAGSATTTSTYTCAHFFGEKKKNYRKKKPNHKFHSHVVQPVATWLLAFCRSSITGALTMELVYVSSVYSSIFTVASRSWTRINVSLSIHNGEAGEWEHNLETCQIRFLLERNWTQVARSEILHQKNKQKYSYKNRMHRSRTQTSNKLSEASSQLLTWKRVQSENPGWPSWCTEKCSYTPRWWLNLGWYYWRLQGPTTVSVNI